MVDSGYYVLNEGAASPLLLTAEHAGNEIPAPFGQLGIDPAVLQKERNLLFDAGVAGVVKRMAARLNATAVLGRYSRLIIDINRKDPADFFPTKVHGYDVPENFSLADREKEERRKRYYDPFHDEIDRQTERRVAVGMVPVLFSIHSFTPAVGLAASEDKNRAAPDIGLLYVGESSLLQSLRRVLAHTPSVRSADNFPYDLRRVPAGSLHRHGIEKGYPSLCVEISIDQLKTEEDEKFFADLLSQACEEMDR